MEFKLGVLITVYFLAGKTISDSTCPPNEEFKECESACAPTCQDKCPKVCTQQCIRGCSCKKGYIREAPGGRCVPEACEGVPICKKNEKFTTCAKSCPRICNETTNKVCTLECRIGCVCVDGYILDRKDGKCIPEEQCLRKCKENEIYKDCGSACPGTCSQPVKPCIKKCVQGCFCQEGYILDDNNKTCIKKEDCPRRCSDAKTSTAIECGENEEPTDCLAPCLPTCSRPYDVTCYFLVCNEGCQCKPGFIRSEPGGSCISPTECGAYCLPHQEYTPCGTACPDTCTERNSECTDNCVVGCYCQKNFILNQLMGECVLENSCSDAK